MTQKYTSFYLAPEVHKELKILAAKNGMPIGQILDAVILFAAKAEGEDPLLKVLPFQYRELFKSILDGWFTGALMEARSKHRKLTIDEEARAQEVERKTREAYERTGLPYPDEEMGEKLF
ncbi:MAG: hypothetical protein WAK96_11345 [Desulfobaccales bacterium]